MSNDYIQSCWEAILSDQDLPRIRYMLRNWEGLGILPHQLVTFFKFKFNVWEGEKRQHTQGAGLIEHFAIRLPDRDVLFQIWPTTPGNPPRPFPSIRSFF